MESWGPERKTLWEAVTEMVQQGLVSGSSGNASMRVSGDRRVDHVLITPMGRPYRQMGPNDLLVVDLRGDPVEGELMPSSETALHLELYRTRQDIGAILHTHSVYASVSAVAGLEIPPLVDEMVLSIGGAVPVAEYAFPTSEELARNTRDALGDRNAVLLRNHGAVGVGRTPQEALDVCQLVERAAQIFVYASLLGKAVPLTAEIVEIERELFKMQRKARTLNDVHAGG